MTFDAKMLTCSPVTTNSFTVNVIVNFCVLYIISDIVYFNQPQLT